LMDASSEKRIQGSESMAERAELIEAALDNRPDGIALLGAEDQIVFWNRAAEAITGYASIEVLSQPVPAPLEALLLDSDPHPKKLTALAAPTPRGSLVETRHKLGHAVQAIVERVTLSDGFGSRIGSAVYFHPAQGLDALPHGETGDEDAEDLQASQAELEERLQIDFDDWARSGTPFGVVWVNVDQAQELRKSHGAAACQAMLEKVRRALAQGLRPGEQMGRWGEGEFLVLAHERTAEMLAVHAQRLAGLARTADFQWWGDRITITASIGAAQAGSSADEALGQLLERARDAMTASNQAGGNRATLAAGRCACSPS
jgi:diguanylate cyclase (GGDEF)-like protein/PAS domain S-box-containing protein